MAKAQRKTAASQTSVFDALVASDHQVVAETPLFVSDEYRVWLAGELDRLEAAWPQTHVVGLARDRIRRPAPVTVAESAEGADESA